MKKFVWLDDKRKTLTVLNRNYFFAVTVFFVLFNITVHGDGTEFPTPIAAHWGRSSIHNLFVAFFNSFEHINWQHALLNMLCFFVAGLYLERKKGSLPFALFLIVLTFFTAFASSANAQSLNWRGFSGVNFGLYGYIIVEYFVYLLQKKKRDLFNLISGAVVIALIYFAMCFNGGTSQVSFTWYPSDLLYNVGHASGFFVGLIVGVYEQACMLISAYKGKSQKKEIAVPEREEEPEENSDKPQMK